MPRLTKAEQIAKMNPEDLGKLKGEAGRKQLVSYLKTLRTGYNRRIASFKRQGVESYAQIAFENSIPENIERVPINMLTRNQLILEVIRYSNFFNAQTSNLAGIRKVNKKQDARIFGVDSRGTPLYQMDQGERKRYWKFYDEFKNQNPSLVTQPFSEFTQQLLADMIFEDDDFKKLSWAEKLEYAKTQWMIEYPKEQAEDGPNVYGGKGV